MALWSCLEACIQECGSAADNSVSPSFKYHPNATIFQICAENVQAAAGSD